MMQSNGWVIWECMCAVETGNAAPYHGARQRGVRLHLTDLDGQWSPAPGQRERGEESRVLGYSAARPERIQKNPDRSTLVKLFFFLFFDSNNFNESHTFVKWAPLAASGKICHRAQKGKCRWKDLKRVYACITLWADKSRPPAVF